MSHYNKLIALYILALFPYVFGHAGEHHSAAEVATKILKRNFHTAHIGRRLARCDSLRSYHELQTRAKTRRHIMANLLRNKRNISPFKTYKTSRSVKTLGKFAKYNHNFTSWNFIVATPPTNLFDTSSKKSCVLAPEVTEGPYFVSGEYIRSNVTETQKGVPVYLEYQFIDVSTCEGAKGLYIDLLHANSTGVYSGVQAIGNGNSNDNSNLNNTALHGVQPTDHDGVAAFSTIFPGHYLGRATHIHLLAHENSTVFGNNTYGNDSVAHVGQIFFPQDLIADVEATHLYNTNMQELTKNKDDSIAAEQADNNYDAFVSYAYLEDDITDGLLVWISVGVDLSTNYTVSAAATWTLSGGVESSDSSIQWRGAKRECGVLDHGPARISFGFRRSYEFRSRLVFWSLRDCVELSLGIDELGCGEEGIAR